MLSMVSVCCGETRVPCRVKSVSGGNPPSAFSRLSAKVATKRPPFPPPKKIKPFLSSHSQICHLLVWGSCRPNHARLLDPRHPGCCCVPPHSANILPVRTEGTLLSNYFGHHSDVPDLFAVHAPRLSALVVVRAVCVPQMDNSPPRKRARLACRACRQSKVRCQPDGSSCPRCLRLGIVCTIDPAYQRTTRRSDVERLEYQVHQLQRLVKDCPRTVEHSSASTATTSSSPVPTTSRNVPTPPRLRVTVDANNDRELGQGPIVTPRTETGDPVWRLGDEEVSKIECLRLFNT